MDSQDTSMYRDLLNLSEHSSDNIFYQNDMQNPSFHKVNNSLSQPSNTFIRRKNNSQFPSISSSHQGILTSNTDVKEFDAYLNFDNPANMPDQFQTPLNIKQKTSSISNQEIPPSSAYQKVTNFPNQGIPQNNNLQDMNVRNFQELMMNPNLLQQFTQWMHLMNLQGQNLPPFQNPSFNAGFDGGSSSFQGNMFHPFPQQNSSGLISHRNQQVQPDNAEEEPPLKSESELITGNFNSIEQKPSVKPQEKAGNSFQKNFDDSLSNSRRHEIEEFENIENNLDKFNALLNKPTKNSDAKNGQISQNPQKELTQNSPLPKNKFDEIKIKGANRRFEDLLEEQLREHPDAVLDQAEGVTPKASKHAYLPRRSGLNPRAKKSTLQSGLNEEKENFNENSSQNKQSRNNEKNRNNTLSIRNMNENNVLKPSLSANSQNLEKNRISKYGEVGNLKPSEKIFGNSTKNLKSNKQISNQSDLENVNSKDESDEEAIQFDEPEDWASPLGKKYNINDYTKQAQIDIRKEKNYPTNSESPTYKFNDDEIEEERDSKKPVFESKKMQNNQKTKGQYFWERDEEVQEVEKPKEKKQTKPVERENKVQVYMNSRLEALEKEITKFKAENDRVEAERKQWKQTLQDLEKEKEDWENDRENQKKELDEWKQEETKKIKKERKLIAESHKNMYQNAAGKKERGEIENLKKQLEDLQEEIRSKDKKAKANLEKLKKKLDEENQKTLELKQEIKHYEEMRIKGNDLRNNRIQIQSFKQNAQQQSRNAIEINNESKKFNYDNYRATEEIESEEEEDREDIIHEEDDEEEDSGDERTKKLHYSHRTKPSYNGNDSVYEQTSRSYARDMRDGKSAEKSKRTPSKMTGVRNEGKSNARVKEGERSRLQNTQSLSPDAEEYDDYPSTDRNQKIPERKSFSNEAYKFSSNAYYQKYLGPQSKGNRIIKELMFDDGKVQVQRIYEDGRREEVFFNGVRRQTFSDGYNIIYFTNRDIKQTLPDSTIVYYYAEAQTTQTKLPNGECVYRFNKDDNNQVEFHYPDDSKDIYFPDGSRKIVFANQEEETIYPDGTVNKVDVNKIKTIITPNGIKETIFPNGQKIRIYPDGRTKKFYPDGSVEIS